MKLRILIGPSSFGQLDPSPIQLLEQAGCEIVPNPYKRRYSKDEIIELLKDIDGLIAGLESLDREVLEQHAKTLKVISRCGAGMSNVDLDAANELGIAVLNTPDGPTEAVAELTLGSLLCVLRSISVMNQSLHTGSWDKRIGFQLAEKTVAIIGFGRIGRRFVELLQPFNVRILIVDPAVDTCPEGNFSVVDLAQAVAEADIISLHLSGEACILGTNEFASMKDGVVVLNAARGGSIDENALTHALDQKKVAGAWLDALPKEPYDGPLTNYEQVLLTPHVGSYTREGRLKMEIDTARNLLHGLGLD